MSAFINLNKQDAFVVPYTAHKSYYYGSNAARNSAGIKLVLGEKDETLFLSHSDSRTGEQYNKLAYSNIKQLYYSNFTSSIESGSFDNFNQTTLHFTRSLEDKVVNISIPRQLYGDNIKPGTFKFNSGSIFHIIDDGEGNLFASGGVEYSATVSSSIESTITYFQATESANYDSITDPATMILDRPVTAATGSLTKVEWGGTLVTSPFYLENGSVQTLTITEPAELSALSFGSLSRLDSVDVGIVQFQDNSGTDRINFYFESSSVSSVSTDYEIYPSASIADGEYIGNIFYSHGNVVINNELIAKRFQEKVLRSGSLEWKGSHTLYQHNYYCRSNESALNYSQNPSTVISGSDGQVYGYVTSSYYQPYVTTVGLYNGANELVAVGKLAQPVPKSRYNDMTFVVKFDV